MPKKARKDTYRVALSGFTLSEDEEQEAGKGSIRRSRVVRLFAAPAVRAVKDAHTRVPIVREDLRERT